MNEYDRMTRKLMFDGKPVSPVLPYFSLDADRETAELVADGNGRISLSGVQHKYSMVVDNNVIRLTTKGERGHYILKPAPTAPFILDRQFCPINEHLTMHLAKDVYKMEVAPCCLCKFGNGQYSLLVRRFDIGPEGMKYAQEDFAQIAGIDKKSWGDNFKYDALSYEDCAFLIRNNVKAWAVEMLKFFRLILFNYICLNDDAHIKNFSLIERRRGDYVLSPAYDLMNTSLHLSIPGVFALTKGLFKEGTRIDDTHGISAQSFIEFARRIGLPEQVAVKEIKRFAKDNPQAEAMIMDSLLSDFLKKQYLSSMKYRQFTIR